MADTVADTRRLITKPQNLNDAYGPPSNFLEIDVSSPQTVGVGRGRFTTYEIRVKVRDLSEAACLEDWREGTGLVLERGDDPMSDFSSWDIDSGLQGVGPVILPLLVLSINAFPGEDSPCSPLFHFIASSQEGRFDVVFMGPALFRQVCR